MMRLLLVCFLITASFFGYSQDLPQVIPPSPTVANLMAFEELPIDYHTGQPDISIPLISKQVSKDLLIGATLKYSTQGVQVDSRSSWVGTGWSLDIGGVISRTVRGFPDENTDYHRLGVFHNDDFWNYAGLSNDDKQNFLWNAIGSTGYTYETLPDLYQYSYPGGAGRFMIEKVGSALIARPMTSGERIKIDLTYSSNFEVSSFQITDTRGLKYQFDFIETISNTVSNFSRTQKDNTPEDQTGGPDNLSSYTNINSAWHLSKILSANDKQLASFTYHTPNVETYQLASETENNITSQVSNELLNNICNNEILKPSWSRNVVVISSNKWNLEEILFQDGSKINLKVKSAENHPETGGNILESITFFGNDGVSAQKRYDLGQQTIGNRLWLDAVTEVDLISSKSRVYSLGYLNRANLPAHNALGNPTDGWGYYNGETLNGKGTNPALVTTGLLTSIAYPTGGIKQFYWESNNFSNGAGEDINAEQIEKSMQDVSSISIVGNLSFSGSSTPSNNNGVIHSTLLNIDFDQEVFVDVQSLSITPSPSNPLKLVFKTLAGSVVQSIIFDDSTRTSYSANLDEGSYTCELVLEIELGSFNVVADIDLTHRQVVEEALGVTQRCAIYGGGVRIGEVRYMEGLDTQRRFIYSYHDPLDSCRSSGAVDGILGSLQNTYNVSTKKYLFGSAAGQGCEAGGNDTGSFSPQTIHYEVVSKGVKANLSKGNYVGYKHVQVAEEGNGYTSYDFTTAADYPNPVSVLDYPFLPPKFLDHKRGLLEKQEVFDSSGRKLQSVISTYDMTEVQVAAAFKVINQETCEWAQFYDSYSQYDNQNFHIPKMPKCLTYVDPSGIVTAFPCLNSTLNCGETTPYYSILDPIEIGWSRKNKILTTQYFVDSQSNKDSVVSKQTFQYNSDNYQVSVMNELTSEAGDSVFMQTQNYYPVGTLPSGYTEIAGVNALAAINKVNEIIYSKRTRTEGQQPSPTSYVISTTKNVYDSLTSGIVALAEVYAAKGDNALEKRIKIHEYDGYGNIVEISKANATSDDVHTVYLWSHNSTVPVAKIDNTTWSEIPTSIQSGNGTLSESDINSLRTTFPNKQITSFLYDDGMRLEEVKDPNNQKTYYEYDGLGRLIRMKDHDLKLLQEITYKTKN